MPNAGRYSGGNQASDEVRRLIPFGRDGNQPYIAIGCLLPPFDLFKIRRSHMFDRMCAARAVFGRNKRAFDMERLHRLAFGHSVAEKFLFGGRQVPKTGADMLFRSSNDCGKETRNAGSKQGLNGLSDGWWGSARVVE